MGIYFHENLEPVPGTIFQLVHGHAFKSIGYFLSFSQKMQSWDITYFWRKSWMDYDCFKRIPTQRVRDLELLRLDFPISAEKVHEIIHLYAA